MQQRTGALPAILLIIALGQASWVLYSTVTGFEVDIDHGRQWARNLTLGMVTAAETTGILLVLFRRGAGFVIALIAEVFRALIAWWTSTSSDDAFVYLAAVGAGALIYAQLLPGDRSAEASRVPPEPDLEPAGRESRTSDTFLSYSRRQYYFAESLMLRLESQALSVWFDTRRIHAGADWKESVDQGLSACTSLVLVASRDALASPSVDYEWRTALENGKPIHVVLFENVGLPPELSREAVAILDMRSRFESKARMLARLLARPKRYRDRTATALILPPSVLLVTTALLLILAASLFFDVLNARTLVAITTPHPKNIPESSSAGFTTHLLGFTFHGLPSKVFAFLGIAAGTLLLTTLTAFLLTAVLRRRRFAPSLLPLTLLGSGWLYLNTSFLQHSTDHIVTSISSGWMTAPANLHSSAWRDLDDMLLGRHVPYDSSSSFDYGSPFLSVGDAAPFLTATSAQWRWPALVLLALGVVAFLTAQNSDSWYRRLATGNASEKARLRHNRSSGARKGSSPIRAGRPPRLLHHPADSHIAAEIADALPEGVHTDGDIVLLTQHTELAWLEDLERENAHLIYVVCTDIQPADTWERLHRYQWFDYRSRSSDSLALLAQGSGRLFPALPEALTRRVLPGPVRYKSLAMKLCATWLLALALFGQGRVYSGSEQDAVLSRVIPALSELMFWICVPGCLYLFWLATELTSSRTTYARFQRRLNIVMAVLYVTQLRFLLSFDDQFSLVLLGTLANVFMAMVWFTPDADRIRRWLPEQQSQATGGTLAVPLRHRFARESGIYLALFVFFYLSSAAFFADIA
ncbi:toll/interleukin-1 receptor domain-containing protein [Nonomuraea sp. NPDC049421]|uniref:toll/interleukin-1 receptor domain-containing protein n=1 Tax=Nonomuraea sp. NPDC049421 TaxID=3155275 RepID=UPI003438E5D4